MAKRKSQETSTKKQQPKSSLERRAARQKIVARILRVLGYSGTGLGSAFIVKLLMKGQIEEAVIIGCLTFSVTILAIASKFISELYN